MTTWTDFHVANEIREHGRCNDRDCGHYDSCKKSLAWRFATSNHRARTGGASPQYQRKPGNLSIPPPGPFERPAALLQFNRASSQVVDTVHHLKASPFNLTALQGLAFGLFLASWRQPVHPSHPYARLASSSTALACPDFAGPVLLLCFPEELV